MFPLYVSAGHGVHASEEIAAGSLLYVPALQFTHVNVTAYVPAAHSLHCVDPAALTSPLGQASQALVDAAPGEALYVPVLQFTHDVLVAAAYFPAAQEVHEVDPAELTSPLRHDAHAVEPVDDADVPAEHGEQGYPSLFEEYDPAAHKLHPLFPEGSEPGGQSVVDDCAGEGAGVAQPQVVPQVVQQLSTTAAVPASEYPRNCASQAQ